MGLPQADCASNNVNWLLNAKKLSSSIAFHAFTVAV